MRNLKRALSLTLASVMLLGMMVVGSSAAAGYSDVDEKNNVEAIEVLQAIEVMVGDERGFGPERPVNRAEMAVVMALLLNLDYNYYVSSCPFGDVYDWARGPVGACYANGIVSGRGDGVYDPGATVTAVEAASMLMRALGYFRYQNDYEGNFVLSTVKQGTKIGIFEGVGSSADTPLTRDQVAQMVLNALQTGMVEPDGNTLNLATPDGNIYTGKVNYVNVTSNKDFAKAISRVNASSIGSQNDSPIVELGEQLYNGELKLKNDELDAFGRPSRTWEYKGKAIGTYMKKELLKEEYTVKVTGKDLYDLLGKATIEDKDYEFYLYIDGEETETAKDILSPSGAYFTRGDLNKNNKDGVGATGNGVLTQVFVDGDDKEVTIAIINTYLAKATADYNEKKAEATLEVYAIDKKTLNRNDVYVKEMTKDVTDSEPMPLASEDFEIAKDIKDGDFLLVNVAEGEIQIVKEPEIMSAVTLSAFSKGNYVVTDGTTYDYAHAIEYDPEVLEEWTASKINLKDRQYNLYLDSYGYVAGVDLVEDPDNYLFITGINDDTSNLTATNFKANAIFLDGTMKTIEVNGKKSTFGPNTGVHPLVNRWFTYTVNSTTDVYTVDEINDVIASQGVDYAEDVRINGTSSTDDGAKMTSHTSKKLAQFATKDADTNNLGNSRGSWAHGAFVNDTTYTYDIDVKHVSLPGIGINNNGSAGSSAFTRIYGNDDTVYLTAQVETINAKKPAGWYGVISDVENVTVGVKNANMTTYTKADAMAEADREAKITSRSERAVDAAYGAYSLYKDNGYIIATVVVGEDNAATDNLVYVHTDDVDIESYASADDQWTWTRKVAFNGVETEIKEVGDKLTYLGRMEQFNWYQVKFNAKNEVISVELAENALKHTGEVNGNEYVDDILNLEAAYNDKDNVLWEESGFDGIARSAIRLTASKGAGYNYNEIIDADGPSLKGSTFYARTTDKTGVYVNDDVKVVFTQKNNNKRETSFLEGKKDLEDVIGELNKKGGLFHYEVGVVVKNGMASVVVIRDLFDDGYAPNEIDTSCHIVTADYDDYHTFTITITDNCNPTNVEITEAIRKELVENYNASDVNVKYKADNVDEVSWTTRNGAKMTLSIDAGTLVVNILKTIKIDGVECTFNNSMCQIDQIGSNIYGGQWTGITASDWAAKTAAAHPYIKITYKDGSADAFVLGSSTTNLWTEVKKIASITTGYLTADGMTAEEAKAKVEENIEHVENFTPSNVPNTGDFASVPDLMAPDVTTAIDGTDVIVSGTYEKDSTKDYSDAPWGYTGGQTGDDFFLIVVGFYGPEGAKGAHTGNGIDYHHATQLDMLMGLLVPVDTKTTSFTIQWYADEACTIPMGDPITYTIDASNVTVTEAP